MAISMRIFGTAQAALFTVAGLGLMSSHSFAAPKMTLLDAQVGSRTLVLTVDEPVQLDDLRSIQVEGYDVDQATWVEEADSLVLSPLLVDLTAPGAPKVRDFIPAQNSLILEAPLYFEPKSGLILADTAFGGVLCRIVQAATDGPTMGVTRRWVIVYEPASVEDVFIAADIRFRSTFDMSVALSDSTETSDVLGMWPDSTLASAQAQVGWKEARIRLQPELFGHLTLEKGRVRSFDIGLQGLAEVAGRFHLNLKGQGKFAWERALPYQPAIVIPVGHGMQLKATHRPVIGMRAESTDSILKGSAQFRLQQEMKSGFQALGIGQPFGDAKLSYEVGSDDSSQGNGTIQFQVQSLIHVAMGASDAHRISVVSAATLTQATLVSIPTLTGPGSLGLPSSLAAHPASDQTTLSSLSATTSLPGGASSSSLQAPMVIPTLPATLTWGARNSGLTASGISNSGKSSKGYGQSGVGLIYHASPAPTFYRQRQVKLGASLSFDQRLDSIAAPRGWLLYSREMPLLSPPKATFAHVQKGDGNGLVVICQAFPKADWFSIQGQLPNGNWVTVVERSTLSRTKLPDFGSTPPIRLRIVAGNAYGVSLPYPAEGMFLPIPNRPPMQPFGYLPDSSTVTDTTLRLTWRSADPDSGSRLSFDLWLDTQNPPMAVRASGLLDSAFHATNLAPNTTYFWRIRVNDGIDTVYGPISSFSTRKVQVSEVVAVPMHESVGNPWMLLPKGSYKREDLHYVSVGSFFLQKYEVSQAEFMRVMGENPSYHVQDSLPVERVTWEEAETYCQAIGGRLPTEAEWEYAGKGGKAVTPWSRGRAGEYAWYRQNSNGHTQKIGQLKPNSFGLHDMAGNVFEWVSDWYAPYETKALENPVGPEMGTAKVIRGASWYSEAGNLNPSIRFSNRPGFRNYKVGFRCAENVSTAVTEVEPSVLAGP